jgi:4-hydroxyphenylpyruvate dioxygenase
MELNIPGIHGVGDSIIYLVDDQRNFSIYDVDFNYYPGPRDVPPVAPGLHFFGLVQYIGPDRSAEWIDFYHQLLGFRALPHGQHFGILPKGVILESPCRQFYLQLVEPVGDAAYDVEWTEQFSRLAFGTPQVMDVVQALRGRGIGFEDNDFVAPSDKGAVTVPLLPGLDFELVHSQPLAPR